MADQIAHHQGAQTAGRAIALLRLIATANHPLGLAEIARMMVVNKSAAYRLLNELEAHSIVVREPNGRRYVPGSGLIALAAMVIRRFDLRTAARPIMEKLSAGETAETVTLHIRHLRQRICIESVEGHLPIRRVVPIGETLPLYAGPTGKVMLAFLTPTEAHPILEWAVTEGQNHDMLLELLTKGRSQGYLALVGDREPGVGGLSVPIFSTSGLAGAITVSGPAERWSTIAMVAAAPFVRTECAALSAALGGAPDTAVHGE